MKRSTLINPLKMTDRWTPGSSYFRSQPSSYYSVATYSPEQLEDLQKIRVLTSLPVLCWVEKAVVIVDFFQIFSLIWNAAQPYPWPYLWTHFSRPLLYLNIDLFSLTANGALNGQSASERISRWGQMDNYLNYAVIYAAVAALLAVAAFLCREGRDVYGVAPFAQRPYILSAVLAASYLLYLPCCTAVFRIYYCEDTDVLSADPSVTCWGPLHGIYLVLCTLGIAPLFLGLPALMYHLAKQAVVYSDPVDHEKRLQIHEVLYMLKLDDYWLTAQLWISSPFRLFGVYLVSHMLLLKAVLLLVFIFVRYDLTAQATWMLVALAAFASYYTFYIYPFRSLSTNIIFGICLALHIVNMSFAMANSAGIQSAVMVGSTEYLFLLVFNCVAYFGIFCVVVYTALAPVVTDWPSMRTLHRIYHDPQLLPKVAHWVEVMRESRSVMMDFLLAPVEIADVDALEECIRRLRAAWSMAKSCGSLFESPLSDLLEQLLYVHSSRLPQALRRLDYWNRAYQHGVATKSFADRHDKHYMMNQRKRRLMVKLLAYKFLQGKYKGAFSFENVAEYKRMTAFEMEMRQRRVSMDASAPMKFSFTAFSKNASALLKTSSSLFDGVDKKSFSEGVDDKPVSQSEGANPTATDIEAGIPAQEEERGFDPIMIEEAKKMISRLQVRTEAALSKHHQAKKTLFEQLQAGRSASAMNMLAHSASNSSVSGGLVKVSTMELMRQTVDVEEQKDLEDLFHLWDDAIQLYEREDFPGDYELLNAEVENWYAYRGLVSQRLELIVQFLQEQETLVNEIGAQEVIEEGDDEDDHHDHSSSAHGRLVSDDESEHRGVGGLVSDDEKSQGQGGRLVSDDEDDDYARDDIVSSKSKRIKRPGSAYFNEDIDDPDSLV